MQKSLTLMLSIILLGCLSSRCAAAEAKNNADSVREPAKKVPVVYDVDVAVAGGGIGGVFAALAAADQGATVVLIDRFGAVGGNIGPGMTSPEACYTLTDGSQVIYKGAPRDSVLGGKSRDIQKFADFFFANKFDDKERYMADSNVSTYAAFSLLEEAGVKLMLSTYIADPIVKNGKVCGVFVETKSGRQAVRAKVVIDATGEADIARRAGAAILYPSNTRELDTHSPTGMGISAVVAGIDPEAFDPKKAKEFSWQKDIGDLAQVVCNGLDNIGPEVYLQGMKAEVVRPAVKVDAGNAEHISALETGMRMFIFEYVQRCRKEIPGCENAYLLTVAPYFGARGGPCIEGLYTLTTADCREAKRFDDAIYVYGSAQALRLMGSQGKKHEYTDVPYRVMIPKKLDGLIAVGRSASSIPDTLLREREGVMFMGQAGGVAAAMAAKEGIQPRQVNVKALQKKLLEMGIFLGDEARLAELGLK